MASSEKEKLTVLIFGLSNSGKTKLLYKIKTGEECNTIPTIGLNEEILEFKDKEKVMLIYDIGGDKRIRIMWPHRIAQLKPLGLIWVYDVSDKETLKESKEALKSLLKDKNIKNTIPLLIYANKSDLIKDGEKVEDYCAELQDELKDRKYMVQLCNINDVDNLNKGINWLFETLYSN